MPCYAPNRTWEGPVRTEGKINIVWKRSQSLRDVEVLLPCGQCIGCREERSRQWAMRIMHETEEYADNSFITLTYDNPSLPINNSLNLSHFQNFMKRLRKDSDHKIRFYHCGEYGENFARPHYHSILFNHDFKDKTRLIRKDEEKQQNRVYTSENLSKLWPYGFHVIGDVTFASAAYVARYVLKKVNGKIQEEHYNGLKPEYATMSRRPGIGKAYYDKYKAEIYQEDFIIQDGNKCKPPRFYDNLLDKDDKNRYRQIKRKRKLEGNRLIPMRNPRTGKMMLGNDNDSFRLPVKEICHEARIKNLKRPLEVIK